MDLHIAQRVWSLYTVGLLWKPCYCVAQEGVVFMQSTMKDGLLMTGVNAVTGFKGADSR